MSNIPKVGLISGTGEEGIGIALRLAAAGNDLLLGSRSLDRAAEAAEKLNQQVGTERIQGAANPQVVSSCEILFLTVPFKYAKDVVLEHRERFTPEQILVDVTVPVSFEGGPHLVDLEEGSGAEHLQALLPGGPALVGAFKTLPAHYLCELGEPLDCDEFVCSDSREAKERLLQVVEKIPTLRWLDAGPLRYSRCLEGITWLSIALNRRYKSNASRTRIVGI